MGADTEGKIKANYLNQTGDVTHGTAPTWDFLYRTSTIQDSEYNVGDRVVRPNGSEYVYSKSVGVLFAAHGCRFTYTGLISYTAFATNHAVGVSEITVPAATHAALTEDELRGGYIILFDGATDLASGTRQIVGNDVSAANVAFKIRLDASLSNAIVSGTEAIEVYRNPFMALGVKSAGAEPTAGLPTVSVDASGKFFWCQTKGICWVAPQGTVNNNEGVGVNWRHDGSLDAVATALGATVPDASGTQYAGHLVAGTQAGNGPLLMIK